jgi:hypothetical protein
MALVKTSMSLIGNGLNSLWLYRTADLKAAVIGANYFDGMSPQLNVGDFIMAATGIGGTVVPALLTVSDIADGEVTVIEFPIGT